MQERFSHLAQSIKGIFAKLSKTAKMLIAAGVLLLVFVGIGATFLLNNTPYEVLFTGLTDTEMTEISGKLQEYAVEMKTEANGTILVPEKLEPQIKAKLVSEGYPKSGFTYDTYKNNINLMTTDSEKKFFELADLQDRISSVIRLFDGVKDAKVIIALGDESKYVLEKDKVENTASVTVIMKDGGSPTPQQVKGIQNLVARSIPGVEIEKIAVLDGNGNDVSSPGGIQSSASALKLELEREIEKDISAKIIHLLEPIYGEGKVKVAAKSQVDIDKKIKEMINYLPNDQNKGATVKEQTTTQGTPAGGATTAAPPGTDANADIPTYEGVTTNGEQIIFKDDKAYEYVVSQVKEQVQTDAATLLNTTVSITIDTVDIPVSKKAEIKRLVANASGIPVIDADTKIEILSTPFAKPAEAAPSPLPTGLLANLSTPVIIAIAGIVLAVLLILIVIILTMRSKKKKKEKELLDEHAMRIDEATPELQDEGEQLPSIDELRQQNMQRVEDLKISTIKDTREMQVQAEIANFTNANPEIAAQLIKKWLRGGENDDE